MTGLTLGLALLTAGSLTACGDPGSISESALPSRLDGARETSVAELTLEAVAAEAIDTRGLETLLRDAGFEAALERSYAGSDPGVRRIAVLLVRFDSATGAERFLEWGQTHVGDVIGDADPLGVDASGPVIYVHLPDGCCAKEQVSALATWRRGVDVFRVLVSGPDADGPTTASLIADLRGSLGA